MARRRGTIRNNQLKIRKQTSNTLLNSVLIFPEVLFFFDLFCLLTHAPSQVQCVYSGVLWERCFVGGSGKKIPLSWLHYSSAAIREFMANKKNMT